MTVSLAPSLSRPVAPSRLRVDERGCVTVCVRRSDTSGPRCGDDAVPSPWGLMRRAAGAPTHVPASGRNSARDSVRPKRIARGRDDPHHAYGVDGGRAAGGAGSGTRSGRPRSWRLGVADVARLTDKDRVLLFARFPPAVLPRRLGLLAQTTGTQIQSPQRGRRMSWARSCS